MKKSKNFEIKKKRKTKKKKSTTSTNKIGHRQRPNNNNNTTKQNDNKIQNTQVHHIDIKSQTDKPAAHPIQQCVLTISKLIFCLIICICLNMYNLYIHICPCLLIMSTMCLLMCSNVENKTS
jgi:hypothetical protein